MFKRVKPLLSVPIYGLSFSYWQAHTEALMGSDMIVFFDPAIEIVRSMFEPLITFTVRGPHTV